MELEVVFARPGQLASGVLLASNIMSLLFQSRWDPLIVRKTMTERGMIESTLIRRSR